MFPPIWAVVLLATAATCDYYTSISGLEVLLKAEQNLLNTLEDFLMNNGVAFLDQIEKMIEQIEVETAEANKNTSNYVNNPINAFKLIKRFVSDWAIIDDYVKTMFPGMGLELNLKTFNGSFRLPTDDDLNGAAKGLGRLAQTYNLPVPDLAKGIIQGTKYSSEMSANDCLEAGMSLFIVKEYKQAIPWLLEAMRGYMELRTYDKNAMSELLRYLAVAFYQTGNVKMGLLLTHDALQISPTNEDLLENKKIFLEKLSLERSLRRLFLHPPKEEQPSVQTLYEMTCRGELRQTPTEQRPLSCRYQTNGKPSRLLNPFKVEQLSLDPPVVFYHDVIGESIIAKLIHVASQNITRSTIGNPGSAIESDYRTSKTGWLYYEKHDFLGKVATILEDISGLSLSSAEPLQIVNYGIGGHYGPHYDFLEDPITFWGEVRGNRIATALFYLNDVELGGGTAFPFLKLAVPPVKGSLVLWYNLHESLEPDYRTKHAGCPVLKGSKWILNEWFHEGGQTAARPCSLEQQGGVSKIFKQLI